MSGFGIVALVLTVVVLIKVAYWVVIAYLFEDDVRADEVHLVETSDQWRIRLCRYKPAQEKGEPVFLCHGLTGNQFNFTSPEGESLVDTLVEKGYDCWVIDLRGCRSSKPPIGTSRFNASMDDCLLEDIPASLDFIRKTTGFDKVHWVGHSMGGMFLYAYELTHGIEHIASGTTMGSPPGFPEAHMKRHDGVLNILRRVPGLVELCIRAFSPWVPVFKISTDYAPINWENMSRNVTSRTFYNLLEIVPFKIAEDLSVIATSNEWIANRGEINIVTKLKDLQLPLFTIYAVSDPLIPQSTARAFHDHIASKDKRYLMLSKMNGCEYDYNHVDLAFGGNGREEVYGPIAEWLAAHAISAGRPRKALAALSDATTIIKTKATTTRKKAAAKRVKAEPKPERAGKKKASSKKAATTRKKKPAAKKKATKKKTAKKKTAPKKAKSKKKAVKRKPKAKRPVARKKAAKKTSKKKAAPKRKKTAAKPRKKKAAKRKKRR